MNSDQAYAPVSGNSGIQIAEGGMGLDANPWHFLGFGNAITSSGIPAPPAFEDRLAPRDNRALHFPSRICEYRSNYVELQHQAL